MFCCAYFLLQGQFIASCLLPLSGLSTFWNWSLFLWFFLYLDLPLSVSTFSPSLFLHKSVFLYLHLSLHQLPLSSERLKLSVMINLWEKIHWLYSLMLDDANKVGLWKILDFFQYLINIIFNRQMDHLHMKIYLVLATNLSEQDAGRCNIFGWRDRFGLWSSCTW